MRDVLQAKVKEIDDLLHSGIDNNDIGIVEGVRTILDELVELAVEHAPIRTPPPVQVIDVADSVLATVDENVRRVLALVSPQRQVKAVKKAPKQAGRNGHGNKKGQQTAAEKANHHRNRKGAHSR